MRLNRGEGHGASLAGRTSQNTARIARTVFNVSIAGLSCGRYCYKLSTAMGWTPTAPISTARLSTRRNVWFAGISAL